MAKEKKRTREITIYPTKTGFSLFKKPASSKKDYDFEGISTLRQLLSNEKARMLYTIKNKNPGSIYDLAKILGRNFKSVKEDIDMLQRFGFIEISEEKTKKRIRHRPIVVVDTITIHFNV